MGKKTGDGDDKKLRQAIKAMPKSSKSNDDDGGGIKKKSKNDKKKKVEKKAKILPVGPFWIGDYGMLISANKTQSILAKNCTDTHIYKTDGKIEVKKDSVPQSEGDKKSDENGNKAGRKPQKVMSKSAYLRKFATTGPYGHYYYKSE